MKKILISTIIILLCSNIHSQGTKKKRYLAFDYRIFENTPALNLAKAIANNNTVLIKKMVTANKKLLTVTDAKYKESVLSFAAMLNKKEAVVCLLQLGANPNFRVSKYHSTPFLDACQYSSNSDEGEWMLAQMIKFGADVNLEWIDTLGNPNNMLKNFPLKYVCSFGNLNTLKLLINNGALISKENGSLNVLTGCTIHKPDMLKYFIIDLKLDVSNYFIERRVSGDKRIKLSIIDLLKEKDFSNNDYYQKCKQEIIAYLEKNK